MLQKATAVSQWSAVKRQNFVCAKPLHFRQMAFGPGTPLILAEPKECLGREEALRQIPVGGILREDEGVDVDDEPAVRQQADTGRVPDGEVIGEGESVIQLARVGPGAAAVVAFDEDDAGCTGHVDVGLAVDAEEFAGRQQADVGEGLIEIVVVGYELRGAGFPVILAIPCSPMIVSEGISHASVVGLQVVQVKARQKQPVSFLNAIGQHLRRQSNCRRCFARPIAGINNLLQFALDVGVGGVLIRLPADPQRKVHVTDEERVHAGNACNGLCVCDPPRASQSS